MEYKQKSKRSARYVSNKLQLRFELFREQRRVHLKWLGECWGEVRNHFHKTQLSRCDAGEDEKVSDELCHYSIFPVSSWVKTCVLSQLYIFFSFPLWTPSWVYQRRAFCSSVFVFLLGEGWVPKKQENTLVGWYSQKLLLNLVKTWSLRLQLL